MENTESLSWEIFIYYFLSFSIIDSLFIKGWHDLILTPVQLFANAVNGNTRMLHFCTI